MKVTATVRERAYRSVVDFSLKQDGSLLKEGQGLLALRRSSKHWPDAQVIHYRGSLFLEPAPWGV